MSSAVQKYTKSLKPKMVISFPKEKTHMWMVPKVLKIFPFLFPKCV